MGEESHILIDEVVLPDVNAHWHAAIQDISMAILFGGKERSKLNGRNWSDRQG
jgi:demethylsterigmatocystin 6-O-methyltransferase